MAIDNNGNVGIGTTAPGYKLHVNGTLGLESTIYAPNIGAGTDDSVLVLNSSGNLVTDEIDSRVWGTTLLNGSSLTQNYLTKVDSTTNQLINSAVFEIGGNVGIGTTEPAYKLSVDGAIAGSSFRDISFPDYHVTPGSAISAALAGNVGIWTTAPSSQLDVVGNIELNQYLYFANATTEYLRWDTSDFILSDDLLPSAANTLNLGSTAAEWNSLYLSDGTGSTADGGLFFGSDQDFLFTYDGTNNFLKLSDGTNTFLSVKDTSTLANFAFNIDDVEITEASMSANIPASFNAAGDTEIAYNLNFSHDTAGYIRSLSPLYIEAGDANSAEDLILRSRGSGDVVIGNSTSYFYNNGSFEVKDGATSRFFVNATSGNVGIGTSSPAFKLEVSGDLSANKYVVQNSTDGTSAKGIYMWDESDTNWGIYMGQSGAGKSLGDGTAAAGAQFSTHAIRFRVNNSSTQGFIWENSAESMLMSLRGSDGLLSVAGNVGIGTTTPTHPLTVNGVGMFGTANASETLLGLTANTTGHEGISLYHNGSAGYLTAVDAGTAWHNINFQALDFDFQAAGSGSDMYITSGGNVGIGTTAPSADLAVVGHIFSGNSGSTFSNAGSWNAVIDNAGGAHSRITTRTTSGGITLDITTHDSGWANAPVGAHILTSTTHPLSLGTNNTVRMTLASGGNVGIGITAPATALDVNGVITVRSLGTTGAATLLIRDASNRIAAYSSSLRFKDNVTDLTLDSSKIYDLRPASFRWKESGLSGFGLIAEEVNNVFPEMVTHSSDGQIEGVDYLAFTVLLLDQIQEIKPLVNNVALNSTGDLTIEGSDGNYAIRDTQTDTLITKMAGLAEATLGKIRAGMITTKELVVETVATIQGNLTVNGTLTAQNITSPTITNIETNLQALTTEVNNLQTTMDTVITQDINTGKYFMSAEALTTVNLTVQDSANIASITLEQSNISTTLAQLNLSALEKVTFFGDKVTIAQDGSITSKGEIIAKKGIKVINDDEQLVAEINASGSAYFAEGVTFDKNMASASAVIAAEQTFSEIGENTSSIVTNGEASGQAVLPTGQQELLIRNSKVMENSLIYISPEGTTSGQLLYLDSKKEGAWFKVKVDSPATNEIKFNWWIL